MGWFGVGGGPKQVVAPKPRAPVVAPKPEKGAKTTPLHLDANAAKGLKSYNQGVKAAKTQPLAPMPWAGVGGWLGGLKMHFISTVKKADTDKTKEFMHHHLKDFGPEGQKLLKKLDSEGKFDDVDKHGSSLRNQIDKYLNNGGNPKAAYAILRQIDNPNAITQVNDNTCAGATLQKALCEANPAKYFKVMTRLADKGHAKLPGGIQLNVSKDARKDIQNSDMGVLDRMNAYFQAAATEFANGSATYDFGTDTSKVDRKGTKNDEKFKGVDLGKARDLSDALMGCKTTDPENVAEAIKLGRQNGMTREQAVAEFVANNLKADHAEGLIGRFVAVKSGHHHKAHMIMVKNQDEDGNFHVMDANGREKVWTPDKMAHMIVTHRGDHIGDNTDAATTMATNVTTATAPPPRRR